MTVTAPRNFAFRSGDAYVATVICVASPVQSQRHPAHRADDAARIDHNLPSLRAFRRRTGVMSVFDSNNHYAQAPYARIRVPTAVYALEMRLMSASAL